jgi:hypothetical protein
MSGRLGGGCSGCAGRKPSAGRHPYSRGLFQVHWRGYNSKRFVDVDITTSDWEYKLATSDTNTSTSQAKTLTISISNDPTDIARRLEVG